MTGAAIHSHTMVTAMRNNVGVECLVQGHIDRRPGIEPPALWLENSRVLHSPTVAPQQAGDDCNQPLIVIWMWFFKIATESELRRADELRPYPNTGLLFIDRLQYSHDRVVRFSLRKDTDNHK